MPVYGCTIQGTKDLRVVRAKSAAQARAHLVDAQPLSAEALADAIGKGVTLETATAPVEEPAAAEAEGGEAPKPEPEKEPGKSK